MFNTPEGSRVLKFSSVAIILLVVFLAVQVIYTLKLTANVGRGTPPTNVITVNGKGEAVAVPDIATFTFGVEQNAKTVSDAQNAVTDKINKALSVVKNAGVDDKDVKTVGYNISPHYVYSQSICTQFNCPPGKQTIDGYDVSEMVEVKVRETSKAGAILGSLGSAQVTNISGLTFTIDEIEKVQADAQAQAITDAQAKAKELAKHLGVSLGDIVSFSDSGYPVPMYNMAKDSVMLQSAGASAPQVPAGESKITSNVSITYEIR